MSKPRKKKKSPKRVLALPDLEQAKSAVLNTLTSVSGQRTYDHAINEFVEWYCSEPRLAFNRTVILRYRIHLELNHPPLGDFRGPQSRMPFRNLKPAVSAAAGSRFWRNGRIEADFREWENARESQRQRSGSPSFGQAIARETGQSLTKVVVESLRERHAKIEKRNGRASLAELMAIAKRRRGP